MKNFKTMILIIFIMTAIGSIFAFSYKAPEFRIFSFVQNLDEQISKAELRSARTREEIINDTQQVVGELIEAGQVYNQLTNLTTQFEFLNANLGELTQFVSRSIPPMNKAIEDSNFTRMESIVEKISEEDQELTREMLSYQQSRVEYLHKLNDLTEELLEMLTKFEEMFYETARPSQPILYFQKISNLFEEIEVTHGNYVEATETYYRLKTNYYLILVEMDLRAYFFGR